MRLRLAEGLTLNKSKRQPLIFRVTAANCGLAIVNCQLPMKSLTFAKPFGLFRWSYG